MSSSSIAQRYARLREQVALAAREAGRDPGSIEVVAVTKTQEARLVNEALAAGVTQIGENYVQEAQAKFALLEVLAGRRMPRRHFIGHLQTNKAKAIAALFDVVQSVDRPEAGSALAKAAAALGRRLDVLVQVNVSPSERFGCTPSAAPRLAETLHGEPSLRVAGVMAIGPLTTDRSEISRAFELAAKTFDRVGGTTLSIGMSGDWREAVRAGSTMIRIGTALFGERHTKPVSAGESRDE